MKVVLEAPQLGKRLDLPAESKKLRDALMAGAVLYSQESLPGLMSSGVEYRSKTVEGLTHPDEVFQRGFGDIDDLCVWRCAELMRAGEKASIRIEWRPAKSGGTMFSCLVRRADNSLENLDYLLMLARSDCE
jgi:hypothetical protein